MNRPEKKNALSIALRDQVSDTLERLAGDETLKTIVITGSGDTFCAGFDRAEFASDDPAVQAALWPSSDRFHQAVLRHPLPTIAAINGPALAGGFDLATLCDIRLATTAASFGHPEQGLGDVVYSPLHDLVGGAIARELCLTGRRVDAEEALRIGLVSRVVAPPDLLRATAQLSEQITKAPRDSLLRTKAKALARVTSTAGTPTLQL